MNTCGNKCQVDINGKLFPYTMDIYGGREVGIAHGYSIEMINNVNGRLGDFSGLTNPYYFCAAGKYREKTLCWRRRINGCSFLRLAQKESGWMAAKTY